MTEPKDGGISGTERCRCGLLVPKGVHVGHPREDVEEAQGRRKLPGDYRRPDQDGVRLVTYTKAQLNPSHRLELGGFEGMIVFNDGQQTYDAEHCTFIRLLMTFCSLPNVWNYSNKAHSPSIPSWQTGVALPEGCCIACIVYSDV